MGEERRRRKVKEPDEKMRLVTIHLPNPVIRRLKELVDEGLFPNQSEAIRYAIITMLREINIEEKNAITKELIEELVTLRNAIAKIEQAIMKTRRR